MTKIITRPGMGAPGLAGRHGIGLDEGNRLGHVEVFLWVTSEEEDRGNPGVAERSDQRERELRDRIAKLIEDDADCQRILAAEQADRPRVSA